MSRVRGVHVPLFHIVGDFWYLFLSSREPAPVDKRPSQVGGMVRMGHFSRGASVRARVAPPPLASLIIAHVAL